MDYFATKKFCDDLGYKLPVPRNKEQNDALSKVTRDKNFFVGVARHDGENWLKRTAWLNQYTFNKAKWDFTNWALTASAYIESDIDMANMKVGVFLKVSFFYLLYLIKSNFGLSTFPQICLVYAFP